MCWMCLLISHCNRLIFSWDVQSQSVLAGDPAFGDLQSNGANIFMGQSFKNPCHFNLEDEIAKPFVYRSLCLLLIVHLVEGSKANVWCLNLIQYGEQIFVLGCKSESLFSLKPSFWLQCYTVNATTVFMPQCLMVLANVYSCCGLANLTAVRAEEDVWRIRPNSYWWAPHFLWKNWNCLSFNSCCLLLEKPSFNSIQLLRAQLSLFNHNKSALVFTVFKKLTRENDTIAGFEWMLTLGHYDIQLATHHQLL